MQFSSFIASLLYFVVLVKGDSRTEDGKIDSTVSASSKTLSFQCQGNAFIQRITMYKDQKSMRLVEISCGNGGQMFGSVRSLAEMNSFKVEELMAPAEGFKELYRYQDSLLHDLSKDQKAAPFKKISGPDGCLLSGAEVKYNERVHWIKFFCRNNIANSIIPAIEA